MSAFDTATSLLANTYKVYVALKTIHDAPEVIKTLQVEVARVRGLLTRLIEAGGDDEHIQGRCEDVCRLQPDLIWQARLLTEAANKFLEKATKTREDGAREVKSVMWLLNESEAKDLATKFSAFYGAVSAVCSVSTLADMASPGPSAIRTVDEKITCTVRQEVAGMNEALRQTMRGECERLFEEHWQKTTRIVASALISAARDQREGHSQVFDELSILRIDPQATHRSVMASGSPNVTGANRTAGIYPLTQHSSRRGSDSNRRSVRISSLCDSLDTISPQGSPFCSDVFARRCPSDCSCRCHRSSSECRLGPSSISSGLGIHASGTTIPSWTSLLLSCDDSQCTRAHLSFMQEFFSPLFARVEGNIRFQSCPVHFKIQTPRILPSLRFLQRISLDELRTKLMNREITVNDTDQQGFTILHHLVTRAVHTQRDQTVLYEMMHVVIDAGARHDWEFDGFTVMELIVHYARWIMRNASGVSAVVQSFERNVAKPLLHEDVQDAWDEMRTRRNWNDLHYFLADPPSSSAQLRSGLAAVLSRPDRASYVNVKDRSGWTPLRHAILCCPETVDALLKAGANPTLDTIVPLGYAIRARSWTVVSPLIRAGADINRVARSVSGVFTAPLHDVLRTWYARPGDIRTARELVRHGGRNLDWEVEDEFGSTPLDCAEQHLNEHPNDREAALLYELYRTRRLPFSAQFVERSCLENKELIAGLVSMSLIRNSLEGNIKAIGSLIDAGAMVNERDKDGCTLLHLVAMGVVPNGYAVAIELVRYGGYGVDWDALTVDGETAKALAEQTLEYLTATDKRKRAAVFSPMKRKLQNVLPSRLQKVLLAPYNITREEAVKVLELLQRRVLPADIAYAYPCMHPNYCRQCSSLPCTGHCNT